MSTGPALILVTNDDGHEARGIEALAASMSALGEVWIVAPDRERSGVSHAITLTRPLRVREAGPRRFVTDGATIYQEALRAGAADDEPEMLDLRTRQYAFREIIKDSLYTGIEYDGGFARRWYPEPRSRAVVIDPVVQFGHPVVEESGIPTASLYASYLAEEKNKAVVARLFEITPKQVESAVRFEEKLLQAA